MKKWWVAPVVLSVGWVILSIGAGVLHTNLILAGKITPEQDDRLSEMYGIACGIGLCVIWAIAIVKCKRC
jgi:hypothetical protein